MSDTAQSYCATRETYLLLQKETSSERSELSVSQKNIKDMLLQSMTKSTTECVRTESPDGSPVYLQYKDPIPRKRRSLTSVSDVLALVDADGILCHVETVPQEHLPRAISALVIERTWEPRKEQGPPRLRVLKTKPKGVPIATQPSRETQLFSEQYVQVCEERRGIMKRMKEARAPMRDAEKKLIEIDSEVDAIVSVQGNKFHVKREPDSRKTFRQKWLKEKIEEAVVLTGPRDNEFDTRFRTHLERLVSIGMESMSRIHVKRVK